MNPFYGAPAYGGFPAQQRLSYLEQQHLAPMAPPVAPGLRGRVVMGVEEARAAQIDFDGSVSYFPSPAEGKIYTKSIDLNGLPVFATYVVQEAPAPVTDSSGLDAIRSRLAAVEKILKELGYDESSAAGGSAPAK